jgi:capsular polysaccharide biosynthesis protein
MGSIVLSGLFFAALSFALLMVTEKKFTVHADFLVVQNNQVAQDIYALSRANEYIAGAIEEAIYSELFLNEAIATGIIDASLFPSDRQERLKAWKKMVEVGRSFQGNILKIDIRNDNRADAVRISRAMTEVLLKKNELFRSGAPEDVQVRILSGPIEEQTPSPALIALTALNGFILGILLLVGYRFVRERQRVQMFSRIS